MKPNHSPRNNSTRQRQIGRKVLFADRLHHSIEHKSSNDVRLNLQSLLANRKLVVAICIAVIGVAALGIGASQLYNDQVAASRQAEAVELQRIDRAKSVKADECRRNKAEQKSSLIGKVTYDELYDGDECDR